MKYEFVCPLRCLKVGWSSMLKGVDGPSQEIQMGWLAWANGNTHYPVHDGILQFVIFLSGSRPKSLQVIATHTPKNNA